MDMNKLENQADIYNQLHDVLVCDTAENLVEFIKANIDKNYATICDIGGGTGVLLDIVKKVYKEAYTILVEPCQGMVDQLKDVSFKPDEVHIQTGEQFAETYSGKPLDLVILQGCVHFIQQIEQFLVNIRKRLSQNGIILISHRDRDNGWPFGKPLRKYFELSIPVTPDEIIQTSQKLGLQTQKIQYRKEMSINKKQWLDIIKNNIRIISTIGALNDQEREEELQDLQQMYQNYEEIPFFDQVQRIIITNK